jgi:hypothetical protein
MLGFFSRKAFQALEGAVSQLDKELFGLTVDVKQLQTDWKAQIAALENAADLYNRAAARKERSARSDGTGSVAAVGALEEIRRRRGGF